jgi:anti-anti-sigma factor
VPVAVRTSWRIMTESLRTRQTVAATEAAGIQVEVHVGGEVDLGSAAALRVAIEQAVAVAAVTRVVVDLGEVGFLASSGIGVLVAAHRQAAGRGVTLTVVNPRHGVHRVLEVAGVLAFLTGAQPSAAPADSTQPS